MPTPSNTVTDIPTPTKTPTTNDNFYVLPGQSIQEVVDIAPDNATIIVRQGYYNERVSVTRPVVIEGQGAVMRGFSVEADNVIIRGFEITDTWNDSQWGLGIWLQGSNCLIENNYIHYNVRGGILLYAEPGNESLTANCVVKNNKLYRNSQLGIDVRGRNHIIEDNEIWGTIELHPDWTNPPSWTDADGIHFHGSGHVFRGNYIHDILYSDPLVSDSSHIDCFQTFEAQPYKEPASDILFEQNNCDNIQGRGSGFMAVGMDNVTIQNNLIGAYVGMNVRNTTNFYVYHNNFLGDPSLSVVNYPAGITFTNVAYSAIKNNIFYNLPGHQIYLRNTTGLDAGKNLMFRDSGLLWSAVSYDHTADLWGKPLINVIDAGYNVNVFNDYEDTPRPQGSGFDIGAYEYIEQLRDYEKLGIDPTQESEG